MIFIRKQNRKVYSQNLITSWKLTMLSNRKTNSTIPDWYLPFNEEWDNLLNQY